MYSLSIAIIDSVCLSDRPSIRLSKAGIMWWEDSPMTLVSSWLTSPRNSEGNIGIAGAPNDRDIGKMRNFQPVSRCILEVRNGAR